MQSYLQYRRLGNAVRKQLADFSVDNIEEGRYGTSATKPVNDNEASASAATSDSESSHELGNSDLSSNQLDENISGSNCLAKNYTRKSEKTAIAYSLPGVTVRDIDDATDLPSRVFIVSWDGENDPQHPRNWSTVSRLWATFVVSLLAFIVTAASSINSGILPQNNAAYGVGDVVGSLVDGKYFLPLPIFISCIRSFYLFCKVNSYNR